MEFDHDSERCLDCDGHFRHFPGCPLYRENDWRNGTSLEDRLFAHRAHASHY